jgi:hypothetical protein
MIARLRDLTLKQRLCVRILLVDRNMIAIG